MNSFFIPISFKIYFGSIRHKQNRCIALFFIFFTSCVWTKETTWLDATGSHLTKKRDKII